MKDTIYAHPLYYDILFGWDRSAEARFYDRIIELAGVRRDEQILEVACGTGQISIQLASRGRTVTGMDVSQDMLAFLSATARTQDVMVRTVCADMIAFVDDVTYGAAFNPMSSFRLLRSDADAHSHLTSIADSLRVGGIYVLDMAFRDHADDEPVTTDEEWEMIRDGVTVKATDKLIHVDDNGKKLDLQWGMEGHLRNYTCASFCDRVKATKSFVIESWHPETAREGEADVSVFDADQPQDSCRGGRSMVVLRRV